MPFAATQPFLSSLPAFEPSAFGEPVRVDDPKQDVLRRTLVHTLAVSSGGCVLLLLAITLLTPEALQEAWVIAALGLASVVMQGMLRRHMISPRTIAILLVSALAVSATSAVLSYGSVRSSGNNLFLASMVAAGVFLGQRQMLVVLLIDVVLLAALTWAELQGLLLTPAYGMHVGLRTWITHAAILSGTGAMLMYALLLRRKLTERVQSELQHRRNACAQRDLSLTRFGRIFQASPMPLVAQSMHTGHILEVNPAFIALLGYSREELLGRTDVFLWQDPDERQLHMEELLLCRRLDRSPATLCHFDGHAVPVLLTSELELPPNDQLLVTLVEPVQDCPGPHAIRSL